MAKLAASEAAWQAANAAVMTLGQLRLLARVPVEKWLRDAKLEEIYEGTSDIQRLIIARRCSSGLADLGRLRGGGEKSSSGDAARFERSRSMCCACVGHRNPRQSCRYGLLHDAPHAPLRKSDINRISARRAPMAVAARPRPACRRSSSSAAAIESLLTARFPEVEEGVAHARVLVVDEPRVVAVAQEVRVEQVSCDSG
jgi:hypothetical protein